MIKALFEQNILELNFSFLTAKGESGILLTNNYENIDISLASPDILFALETARIKFNADAVYFRYFQGGRASVPQLYLFDYTQKNLTNKERNRIHIQMWNGYQVPIYIIIEKSSVSLFDSRKKPDVQREVYAKEIITYTGKTIKDFQAKSFDNGLFWDEQNEKKDFKFEQSATRDLIRGLKKVFKDFQEKSNLNRHVALKLLVQSLLIKYLEERDEKSASGYFAGTYFRKNFQCKNFCTVIRKGKLLDLLDQLSKDFNGKIFGWHKEDERIAIQQSGVQHLADYLDGNIQDSQYVLWRLYSFSHLPVEIISSVYEELLTDSKDIVYTPEMIVSTLVDECMPLKSPQKNYKLIDVSCGSGIFLVKAYKRIVQWWRWEQWKKTGELTKPSLSILKELLLKSIHGIDIEQDAIRLSIFSLSLAILDEVNLDPPTWGRLKFPDLSENIISQDFFKYITNDPASEFDLVIGNPPFNLQPADGKEPGRKKYFKELEKKIGYKCEISIPDENPALHFLVQSMKLLKKDALLCLVQPSGPLLYQKDLIFKQELFSKYNLLQVVDFTKLADKLWGRKNVATAAVFLQKAIPDNEDVLHLVANRTFSNTNRLFLEFDHYDFHVVSKEAVLRSPYIWKANLLGGGRIVQLIERLSELPTLGEFLKEKEVEEKWNIGIGFIVGNKKHKADYITDRNYIPVEALTENGVDKNQISKCQIEYFERPRKKRKDIYSPPHLLIREIIGEQRIPIAYSHEYLAFPFGVIGINAPSNAEQELSDLYKYLDYNNEFLRFYIIATSGRMMIGKATSINKEDLMRIPYPQDKVNFTFSTAEEIIVKDVIGNQSGSIVRSNQLTRIQLKDFYKVFCKTLNSIYQTEEKSFQLFKILDTGKYYALHFEYTTEKLKPEVENSDDLEQYINHVIPTRKENQESTHIQKIIKVYGQDCIILAKPKQLRYWLPSIALRDADETFADYIKSRYHNA